MTLNEERPSGDVEPRRAAPALFDKVKWALAMSWGERALGALFTFVLAALLGPHDFGVVAVAMIYIALAHVFLEQGISTAIIQREDLQEDHLHAAFWLNLLWCLALAGVTVAVSGWLADLNDAPVLRTVLAVLALMLPIEALIIVQEAQMQRAGDFRSLAVAANVAALAGGILGVVLALGGAGVWALVAQQLAASGVTLVLIWAISHWRPRFRFSPEHARDLLGFSVHVFSANLGGFVNRRSDTLLVGALFGPVVVGIYRLADRLVDLVLELTARPLATVALPLFSRAAANPVALRDAVQSCLRLTLVAVVPLLLLVAACSDALLALFGPEWEPGAEALKLLAVIGIGKAFVSFTGPLLFALGRPHLRAAMLWVFAAASAATVLAVGLSMGTASADRQLFGVSASRALLFVLVFVPVNVVIIRAAAGMRIGELLALLRAPAAAATAAVLVTFVVRRATAADVSPAADLVLASIPATLAAAGVLLFLEPELRGYARGLVRRSG